MAGSLTQLTQWPTSWRPPAARPIAGSSLAEGPSAMQKTVGRRPKGHAKGPGPQLGGQLAAVGDRPAARRPAIGRQLAAGRDRRAAVQHEAPGEGRRPAGHEPVVSAKLFLFFANRSTILYDVIDAT